MVISKRYLFEESQIIRRLAEKMNVISTIILFGTRFFLQEFFQFATWKLEIKFDELHT